MITSLLNALLIALVSSPVAQAPTRAPDPADDILGIWSGHAIAGTERADLALEITRDPGGVALHMTLPPLRAWRMPVDYLKPRASGGWAIPDWKVVLERRGDRLVGELGDSRVTFSLSRVDRLPAEPARASLRDWPQGPAPLWTFDAGAPFWGSPKTSGSMVFVGDARGRIRALHAATGVVAWTVDAEAPIHGDVTLASNAVFVFDDGGILRKLGQSDGRTIWTVDLGFDEQRRVLPSETMFEYDYSAASPSIDGGVVFIATPQGVLHAIDAETGHVAWRQPLPTRIRASITLTPARLFVGGLDHHVYALDRSTGKVVWRHDALGAVTSAAVATGDHVIVGSRSGWLTALRQSDGAPIWSRFQWFSWVESTGVVIDGTHYLGSSDLRAVRALSANTGATLWETDVLGFSWGTPVVTGDTVYAGVAGARKYVTPHEGGLVALDRRTGRVKWARPAAFAGTSFLSGYTASPAFAEGRLFAANINGTLEAYAVPVATTREIVRGHRARPADR